MRLLEKLQLINGLKSNAVDFFFLRFLPYLSFYYLLLNSPFSVFVSILCLSLQVITDALYCLVTNARKRRIYIG